MDCINKLESMNYYVSYKELMTIFDISQSKASEIKKKVSMTSSCICPFNSEKVLFKGVCDYLNINQDELIKNIETRALAIENIRRIKGLC